MCLHSLNTYYMPSSVLGFGVNNTDKSLTFMKLTSNGGKHSVDKLTNNISVTIRTMIKIKQSRWRVMKESVWEQSRVVIKHVSDETV